MMEGMKNILAVIGMIAVARLLVRMGAAYESYRRSDAAAT